MTAGTLPARYSEARARCPRPGFAAAKVSSIAKRRRQDSSRASRLITNSSNGIGRLRVHKPPGERKSGIPHSVEMPAPVKGTIVLAPAIMRKYPPSVFHATYSMAHREIAPRVGYRSALGRFSRLGRHLLDLLVRLL